MMPRAMKRPIRDPGGGWAAESLLDAQDVFRRRGFRSGWMSVSSQTANYANHSTKTEDIAMLCYQYAWQERLA